MPEQTRLDQGDDTVTLAAPAAETFASALRAAIMASGLGLERIRARLHERGAPLSTATLSYWQSGRSEPARRTSLRALTHLEEILGLPAGSLAVHLDRPASRTVEPRRVRSGRARGPRSGGRTAATSPFSSFE